MLVPSRFEPCGLTQLYGLRYGCVPLVARVGGLADTIIDANDAGISAGVATGIQFIPVDGITLQGALARTQGLYSQPAIWRGLQERGMALREAVIESATLRLRPILMTTGAMVLGAVPLALARASAMCPACRGPLARPRAGLTKSG